VIFSLFSSSQAQKLQMVSPSEAVKGRDAAIVTAKHHFFSQRPLQAPYPNHIHTALFGMGCFWGAEKLFWKQTGVWVTAVGYAGGFTSNPTYREVCTGQTGHTEVVLVAYDPAIIPFSSLVKLFFEGHNPTQGMRQGNDEGTQYRSALFVDDPVLQDEAIAVRDAYTQILEAQNYNAITTQIGALPPFYFAEEEHQQYLAKNPNGYCGLGGTGIACAPR
jgi:peptide-methionine (S)-S-oxide reductase